MRARTTVIAVPRQSTAATGPESGGERRGQGDGHHLCRRLPSNSPNAQAIGASPTVCVDRSGSSCTSECVTRSEGCPLARTRRRYERARRFAIERPRLPRRADHSRPPMSDDFRPCLVQSRNPTSRRGRSAPEASPIGHLRSKPKTTVAGHGTLWFSGSWSI